MEVKLLGLQELDFVTNSGDKIQGYNMFVSFPDANVEGVKTEKLFIKDSIELPACQLNDTLDIGFNMKGKVETLKLTKAK